MFTLPSKGIAVDKQAKDDVMHLGRFRNNWLRVLDTAEGSQVDHRVPQQLHPIVASLDACKPEQ
jgi:hypothetical protein